MPEVGNAVVSKQVIVLQGMEAKRVGNEIRELHQRCGLSLTELACMTNVPDEYLIRLEQGRGLKVERTVFETFGKPVELVSKLGPSDREKGSSESSGN